MVFRAFAELAQAVAFDRVRQDHRRAADVLDGGLVGGIHLDGVVPAAGELPQVVVGEVFDQVEQFRIFAEEMLADVCPGLDAVLLHLAVDDLVHPLDEQAGFVLFEQRVPVAAPDDLDDVPAGAAEGRLQFLDDLAVAADGAVEPLQVAVDDEDQVVELLAGRQRQGAERFGLVGLAVADEAPDVLAARCP